MLGDALSRRGGAARFWWRDDDAGPEEPALSRLLGLADATGWPLALATVPAWLAPGSIAALRDAPFATVIQHGWNHHDHAAPGERKIELGGRWPLTAMALALSRGLAILDGAFGPQFAPVMVPPWNRFRPDIEPVLARLGYAAVSAMRPSERHGASAAGNLPHIDVAIDMMGWDGGPRWLGLSAIVARIETELARECLEPIGLMTHHRVMADADFRELGTLLRFLRDHSCAQILAVDQLLGRDAELSPHD